jgi:uncharacterized protein
MKPLCIYHGNCADGFGAAWVFKKHYGGDVDFHAGVYNDPPPDVTGRKVFLVDFSYKRDVVEKMINVADKVILIDHHKTALEDLASLISCGALRSFSDLSHSGAMLAWIYLRGKVEDAPRLLHHIEDRDLWRFALPYTREIQSNLFSHPYDFTVWDELMAVDVNTLVAEGRAIERMQRKNMLELLRQTKHRRVIGGFNVPVANMPYMFASEAGNFMASSGEFFAATYWDSPTHRMYSLRGIGAVDVSDIAKQYGGGGHANAAGFRVSFDHELGGAPT